MGTGNGYKNRTELLIYNIRECFSPMKRVLIWWRTFRDWPFLTAKLRLLNFVCQMEGTQNAFLSHISTQIEAKLWGWLSKTFCFVQTNCSNIAPLVSPGCESSRPPTGGAWPSDELAVRHCPVASRYAPQRLTKLLMKLEVSNKVEQCCLLRKVYSDFLCKQYQFWVNFFYDRIHAQLLLKLVSHLLC